MAQQKIAEHLKTLLERRNGLVQENNAEGIEILKVKDALDKAHKTDCPCQKSKKAEDCTDDAYKTGMAGLRDRVSTQKTRIAEIGELDELIEAGTEIEEKSIGLEDAGDIDPVTDNGMAQMAKRLMSPEKKGRFLNNIGTDFHGMLQKLNLTSVDDVKTKIYDRTPLADGSMFGCAASFYASFGQTQQEIVSGTKSIISDAGLGESFAEAMKTRRSSMKSMFTQHPLAGGDGSLYAPTEVFPGNTGGLCEYEVDNTIDVLPYPPVSFLECIPVRTISKSYILYARQTLRVNNASAVAESVVLAGSDNPTDAPVSFLVEKPESEFGFSQAKAYTLTFADTLPVSEEFLEDCPTIADAVETQLLENVRQEFYDQIINGDGSDGAYPELVGLLAQVGLSTRVHQGAATFFGNTMGSGSVDDNVRETIARAIFDAEAYGYTVDCVLMNYSDFTDMYFLKDDFGKPLYNDAELRTINGAKVRADIRMPQGVAIVGAFRQVVQILLRRQIRLDIGWVDKQFKQDMLTLRATMRGGLLVKAPHALIRVSGL